MKYEVPVVYRGQCNFIVEADDPAKAAVIAEQRFKGGEKADEFGNEWEEIERIGTVQAITEEPDSPITLASIDAAEPVVIGTDPRD